MSFYSQGDSHIKRLGNTHWKFWKESLRDTKILFCRRGFKFLYPLRGTNSDTKHHLLSYFSAQYPKRYMYCKSSHCCSLKAEHLNRYMYMYQNHLYPFYMWTPPPPLLPASNTVFLHVLQRYSLIPGSLWGKKQGTRRVHEQGGSLKKSQRRRVPAHSCLKPLVFFSLFFHSQAFPAPNTIQTHGTG